MSEAGSIERISGGLAVGRPMPQASLYELARVGERGLLAEVIRVEGDACTLQVYEETTGLNLGEPVNLMGRSLTARLGPGLLGSVVDGVGRPLERLADAVGDFIEPGVTAKTLGDRSWSFEASVEIGARVGGGDAIGEVDERGFSHRILVPPGVTGIVARIESGEFTVEEPVAELDDGTELYIAQEWPVRQGRPFATRISAHRPFVTGQRVLDFLFPVAEGGSVALPGGFGTGKTIIEHSLARYAEADIMVFVGCGERGNEMTELLSQFPELEDPRTGRLVMDRTVLVVNTSNMPVAARESSIFIGATIAEYYRDLGFRVALLVDSTSRWAEALREISSRLGEMPGEEGYPTYLASRLGAFYERSGRVRTLGARERTGAVTIISAISPPGGDLSEPVTQASLRVTGALWALDAALANQRHFPAVDWDLSYSHQSDLAGRWYAAEVGEDWPELRRKILSLLQRERELREIASLVGPEALEDRDRLIMDAARAVREIVLQQSAFDPNDAYSPPRKTYDLARLAYALFESGEAALEAGASFAELSLEEARNALTAARDAGNDQMDELLSDAERAVERIGQRKEER